MLVRYALNQLRSIDVWIGANYDATMPSLLILGQSDSGVKTRLSTYVPDWIKGRCAPDATFTAIYNACSASNSPAFNVLSKPDFWNAIAFYNFIPGTFPTVTKKRPSVAAFKSGIRPLHLVLDVLRPHGVFIVGLSHSDYSLQIVQARDIPYVVVPHPTHGVSASFITESFVILIKISTPK